jgi:hypothetical protein
VKGEQVRMGGHANSPSRSLSIICLWLYLYISVSLFIYLSLKLAPPLSLSLSVFFSKGAEDRPISVLFFFLSSPLSSFHPEKHSSSDALDIDIDIERRRGRKREKGDNSHLRGFLLIVVAKMLNDVFLLLSYSFKSVYRTSV